MDRDQKAALVDELTAELGEVETIFAVDYRGISVPQAAELRAELAEADARFRVVKNRLAKLAVEQAGVSELEPLLDGPTALTFVRGDAAMAAKAIHGFFAEHEILSFKGGLMDGAPLDEERFQAIARLPALDVLQGQFVGVIASPITGLTRGLASMISGLANQLAQIEDQKQNSNTEEETPDDTGGEAEDVGGDISEKEKTDVND